MSCCIGTLEEHKETRNARFKDTERAPQLALQRAQRQYDALFEASRARAYSMALRLTRNPSDADDLLQETAIKAWRKFDSYLPGRPFLNWVLRIMQHAYLDIRRRDNPIRKADPIACMVSPTDGELQDHPLPDKGPGPLEEALHEETVRELDFVLRQLPEAYEEAIRACDLEGLSYAEIAQSGSSTLGTIRSRIHRGRRMLKDRIVRQGLFGYEPPEFPENSKAKIGGDSRQHSKRPTL